MAKQVDTQTLRESLRLHALPEGWEHMAYKDFLEKRRRLMAEVVREGFEKLCGHKTSQQAVNEIYTQKSEE